MLPSRFKALNSDTSEESDSNEVPAVTKEALEQKAIAQYQIALQLEQKGEWEQTEKLLRELLKTDIITQVTGKMAGSGNAQSSLVHLKYCITLNLGHCLAQQKKVEKALKFYIKATKLDDGDLNLWYRMGKLAMSIADLYLAVSAFEEGLRCSPNHWPCIDNLVTLTYALGDYMACLFYISKGLNMDVGFLKGHAFKEKIFTLFPSLASGFHMYYPNCNFPVKPDSIVLDSVKVSYLYREAEVLREKESVKLEANNRKSKDVLRPPFKVKLDSWINLAKFLLYLFDLADQNLPQKIAFDSLKFSPDDENGGIPVEIEDVGTSDECEEVDEKSQPPEIDEEEQGKSGRSNGNLIEKLASSQKRRSARVRSTIRREEPSLTEAFRKLIPSHLLPLDIKREGECLSDELDTMDLYRLFELKDSSDTSKIDKLAEKERHQHLVEEGYFGTESEEKDIFSFIKEIELSEKNLVDAMHFLLMKLSEKWKIHWPEILGKYFVQINLIVQQYFPIATKTHDVPSDFYENVNLLLFGELLLHEWIKKGKRKGLPSPLGFNSYGGEFSSLNLGKLNHQAALTNDLEFVTRSYWLEALLFLHCGDREASVRALQQIIDDERCEKICIKIPNISHNAVISSKIAATLLKALKRNKSLSQVLDLYNSGYYNEVTDILSDSLSVDPDSSATCDTISRSMQYAIILDSYWKLTKFKECLYWTECCLHESLNQYRNASDEEERQDFAKVIVNTLKGIMNLIEKQGLDLFKTLLTERLSRMVHTLCSIINHQMEAPENSSEMPIESVSPWIILHYIIKYDEGLPNKNIRSLKEDEEEELLASIQILFQGHEYLGRRSWCCFDEGGLLFHTLEILYPLSQSLSPESQNLININQQIDQIFYCLYGIQKKHKTRHMAEHNVLGLALTWNRAQQIFVFTRPRDLPSYDTVGKCCMSADNEALFLKLIKLVPDNCNPNRLVGEMMKYVDGEVEEIPKNDCSLPIEVVDIYFLLAHFYYKSKSWAKVWHYSLLDVCANPTRHASWAGLALSRGTEIETKLNSCETIKNEGNLLSLATTVCRCYKKSLDLDPTQNTLWIEKGTFSYTIHSFCSNVLKKEQNLSIEMYHMLEEQKESMLARALQCFLSANKLWHDFAGRDIHDERWLHHYMFGKIAKKKDEEPSVYINHFLKSAVLLHDIGALYPTLITYNSPQYLAVEALELFYRVHTCILKTLEEAGDKPLPNSSIEVFKHAINVLSESPFVTQAKEYVRHEKPKKTSQRKTDSSSDEDLPVSKDVKDMIQDILGKVESDHSSSNPLKRKLLPIEEEPENVPLQTEVSLDEEVGEPSAISNIEKATNSSSTSETTKDIKRKGEETSTSSSSSSSSKSSSSSSDSSSSSSNSSSGSSSSSDSSSSDTSSDSSSDSDSESDSEPPSKKSKLEVEGWSQEQQWLVEKCIGALELCKKRFPEHYKSTYHLAHFYFKTKHYKNNDKVKELLLGQQGLFSERRTNNFFNGIWRIPNGEIDRPGSFAAHMGRCTLLLLEFLRESKDYNMLLDLAIHLKIIPEADKKYLRDNEREELSKEAATLCVQSLRKKMQELDTENLQKFILELYYIYKRANKSNLKEPRFTTILNEAYQKLNNTQGETSSVLDSAVRYCQQQIQLEKQSLITPPPTQTATVSQTTPQLPVQPQVHQVQQQSSSPSVSCLIPPSISSPVTSQESLPSLFQGNIALGLARRGARAGTGRKPRGRPPGSGLGPRLPRGMSVSLFVSQQTELLRHYAQQNAELTRQLAAQNANVNSTLSTNSNTSGQVLKDRPNLSITPLKPSVPTVLKSAPTSPSAKQITSPSSISVSVSKKSSPQYKSRKTNPLLPPISSVQWPSGDAFRPPGLSIQPIQSTAPKSSNQEVSLQHKILGAKKIINVPEKCQPKKLTELPFSSTGELTVRQISPKPKPPFIPRPPHQVPRKEVVNSISIIPTSKVESSKNVLPLLPIQEEKSKSMNKPQTIIPNIDSSVADALRTFGSTITITTTPNKKPAKIHDEMSITPVQQKKPKTVQEPCEVIVLDD